MRKKGLAIILVLSHLLCVLFGYCIGSVRISFEESMPETRENTQATVAESAKQTLPITEFVVETVAATTEETNLTEPETTEATDSATVVPETTQPPTETQTPATTPVAPQPPVETQPSATEPPATNPPVTEYPAVTPGQPDNSNKTPEEEV